MEATINPLLFNEEPLQQLGNVTPERDTIELELVNHMLDLDKPILGICRGHQVLNVAFGGTLYQDIISQIDGPILQHDQKAKREYQSHKVHIEKDTLFASIANSEEIIGEFIPSPSIKGRPFSAHRLRQG